MLHEAGPPPKNIGAAEPCVCACLLVETGTESMSMCYNTLSSGGMQIFGVPPTYGCFESSSITGYVGVGRQFFGHWQCEVVQMSFSCSGSFYCPQAQLPRKETNPDKRKLGNLATSQRYNKKNLHPHAPYHNESESSSCIHSFALTCEPTVRS